MWYWTVFSGHVEPVPRLEEVGLWQIWCLGWWDWDQDIGEWVREDVYEDRWFQVVDPEATPQ